jgi:hypothetical protein
MTISVLCESPRDRRRQEKCASKCARSIVLSAFIYFLARNEFEIEIRESDLSSHWVLGQFKKVARASRP